MTITHLIRPKHKSVPATDVPRTRVAQQCAILSAIFACDMLVTRPHQDSVFLSHTIFINEASAQNSIRSQISEKAVHLRRHNSVLRRYSAVLITLQRYNDKLVPSKWHQIHLPFRAYPTIDAHDTEIILPSLASAPISC